MNFLEGRFPSGDQIALLRGAGWTLVSTSGPMVALSPDGSRSIPWPDAVAEVAEQAEARKAKR
jgi:hypothetical protein